MIEKQSELTRMVQVQRISLGEKAGLPFKNVASLVNISLMNAKNVQKTRRPKT